MVARLSRFSQFTQCYILPASATAISAHISAVSALISGGTAPPKLRQKTSFLLVDEQDQPIRDQVFWRETALIHVLTRRRLPQKIHDSSSSKSGNSGFCSHESWPRTLHYKNLIRKWRPSTKDHIRFQSKKMKTKVR